MQASLSKNTVTQKKSMLKSKALKLSSNDLSIVQTLSVLKNELDYLHNSFNFVTDPILIDSYIYEIMSVHMKYQYYLKLCKERGLIANVL